MQVSPGFLFWYPHPSWYLVRQNGFHIIRCITFRRWSNGWRIFMSNKRMIAINIADNFLFIVDQLASVRFKIKNPWSLWPGGERVWERGTDGEQNFCDRLSSDAEARELGGVGGAGWGSENWDAYLHFRGYLRVSWVSRAKQDFAHLEPSAVTPTILRVPCQTLLKWQSEWFRSDTLDLCNI